MEKLEHDYNIFDWWKKVVLKNYANFEGRARRKEYWSFQLVNFIIIIPIYVLFVIMMLNSETGEPSALSFIPLILMFIFGFSLLLPSIAVAIRRLHDTNKSGWYLLLSFIPVVSLILLVFYFTEGVTGENDYGADPKNPINELNQIGRE